MKILLFSLIFLLNTFCYADNNSSIIKNISIEENKKIKKLNPFLKLN